MWPGRFATSLIESRGKDEETTGIIRSFLRDHLASTRYKLPLLIMAIRYFNFLQEWRSQVLIGTVVIGANTSECGWCGSRSASHLRKSFYISEE